MTHRLKEEHITYLVGDTIVSSRPLEPYNPLLCEFLNDLSSELRSSKEAASYSDIMSFAFWCRRGNIAKHKADFEDGNTRLGLGVVFHITPSNVPINFAFSYAFGLLSGNANVVKVPRKPFIQINIICSAINRLFNYAKYNEIKEMTLFVNYNDFNEITSRFSEECNARIIWGGDATIKNIRKMPIPVRGVEIAFSDRYSICVMDTVSIVNLSDVALKQLAENFYNDTYLMDQNACSSPHLIIWLGKRDEEAQERFWTAVYHTAAEKYQMEPINAIDKYTLFCHNAIELNGINRFQKHGNYIYHVAIDALPENIDTLRGKCGYFYEYNTDDINRISHIVNTKYQTLTYFGIEKSQLLDFVVRNRLPGIDRIVPIGRALDIDVIWDGYDIVKSLSRIIDV